MTIQIMNKNRTSKYPRKQWVLRNVHQIIAYTFIFRIVFFTVLLNTRRKLLNTRRKLLNTRQKFLHDKLLNTRRFDKKCQKPYFIQEEVLIINNEWWTIFWFNIIPFSRIGYCTRVLWYCHNHAKQKGYAVATKISKREKNIIIKWSSKTSITEKQRQTASRLNNCPSEIHGKNVDGKWRNLWLPCKNIRHVFSNFHREYSNFHREFSNLHHVFSKILFSSFKFLSSI